MTVTLPLEIYETFEERFGKDDARKLVKSFENAIGDMTEYKWAVTRDELFSRLASKEEISKLATKEEISKFATKEELSRFATKEDLERFATKEDLLNLRTELLGKLEAFALKLDRKFTIMFIILFFTILFTNQNSITFILRLLGIVR